MKKSVAAMLAVCLLLTGCKKTDAVAQYLAEGIAQQIAWMDDIPFTDGPDMGGGTMTSVQTGRHRKRRAACRDLFTTRSIRK